MLKALIVIGTAVGAATPLTSSAPLRLIGSIDRSFVNKLQPLPSSSKVFLTVSGGEAADSLDAAEVIAKKHLNVSVIGLCASSCSEYLLPVASKYGTISFLAKPLIAFHHNTAIVKAAFYASGRKDYERCFGSLDKKAHSLRDNTGVPYNIWRLQYKLIGVRGAETSISSPCRNTKIIFTNDYWFPNAEQLRGLFKLKFTGELCADSLACMNQKIAIFGRDGAKYVIGRETFRFQSAVGLIPFINKPS